MLARLVYRHSGFRHYCFRCLSALASSFAIRSPVSLPFLFSFGRLILRAFCFLIIYDALWLWILCWLLRQYIRCTRLLPWTHIFETSKSLFSFLWREPECRLYRWAGQKRALVLEWIAQSSSWLTPLQYAAPYPTFLEFGYNVRKECYYRSSRSPDHPSRWMTWVIASFTMLAVSCVDLHDLLSVEAYMVCLVLLSTALEPSTCPVPWKKAGILLR